MVLLPQEIHTHRNKVTGVFFKFGVEVGVELSICERTIQVTDHGSAV
jgi:hypothetical protein